MSHETDRTVVATPLHLTFASTAAMVAAVLLMILLHECAHWFTGAALGGRSTMYSFGVDQSAVGRNAVITAAAGPLFSLATGALCYLWQPLRARAGLGQLPVRLPAVPWAAIGLAVASITLGFAMCQGITLG